MDIVGEQRRYFTVGEPTVAFFRDSSPGSEMHLINGNRSVKSVAFRPLRHPGVVLPGITPQIPHSRSGARADFCRKAVGVCFVDLIPSVTGLNMVLVRVALTDLGNE